MGQEAYCTCSCSFYPSNSSETSILLTTIRKQAWRHWTTCPKSPVEFSSSDFSPPPHVYCPIRGWKGIGVEDVGYSTTCGTKGLEDSSGARPIWSGWAGQEGAMQRWISGVKGTPGTQARSPNSRRSKLVAKQWTLWAMAAWRCPAWHSYLRARTGRSWSPGRQDRKLQKGSWSSGQASVLIRKTWEAGCAEPDTHCGLQEARLHGGAAPGPIQTEATVAASYSLLHRAAEDSAKPHTWSCSSLLKTLQRLPIILRVNFKLLSTSHGPSWPGPARVSGLITLHLSFRPHPARHTRTADDSGYSEDHALLLSSEDTLSLEHTLSLSGYTSTFQVSHRPSLRLESALLSVSCLHPAAFLDTPTVLCSHPSGLTILDSNHPPPQIGAKLLEGRAVSVFSAFTHPQRLQSRRTFVSKSKKGRIPRTEEGTAEPPTRAIRARREDGSTRRSVSVTWGLRGQEGASGGLGNVTENLERVSGSVTDWKAVYSVPNAAAEHRGLLSVLVTSGFESFSWKTWEPPLEISSQEEKKEGGQWGEKNTGFQEVRLLALWNWHEPADKHAG